MGVDGSGRGGRLILAIAIAAVAGVAGLSVVSSLTGADGGDDSSLPETVPTFTNAPAPGPVLNDRAALPDPAPGRFAGRIAYETRDCEQQVLDLATGETSSLVQPSPGCGLLLSPNGRFGALPGRAGDPVSVYDLEQPGAGPTAFGPALGAPGLGPPAVSDAGVLAVCGTPPETTDPEVVLVSAGGDPQSVEGCRPAFAGDDVVLASRAPAVAVHDGDGDVIVPRSSLPRASRGDVLVAASGDGDVVGVLSRSEDLDRVDLSLWSLDGTARGAWEDVHSGADLRTLRIASGGSTAAFDVNGVWRLVRVDPDRADAVETVADARIYGADFSPDGQYAAVIVEGEILIVDATTLGPLASIPVDTGSVRWLP